VTVQNISGVEELRERLWNRNLAACLNMIHIVRNLRSNGEIPERFQRAGTEIRELIRERRRYEENEERRVLPRILYPSNTVIVMLPQMYFDKLELKLLDSLPIYIQLLHLLSLNVGFELLVSFMLLIYYLLCTY
jgi:hypothetical protein